MRQKYIRILYLDDEQHNLDAFKATFRRMFEVYTAIDAEAAFKILESVEIHIILADQKMPRVSGIEFFTKVVDLYPDPLRILITAYTQSQTLIDAVNQGQIFRYLTKPWDPEVLRNVIETSYETYKAQMEIKTKNAELIKRNEELSRFVYSISHDLRAPLMSILGLIQVAEHEQELQNHEYYMDLMKQNVHKMDHYIKNLLDYYLNQKGELHTEKLDLRKIIEDIIERNNSYNDQVHFQVDIEKKADFYGDEFRVQLALNNLITNAVKYQNPKFPQHKVQIYSEIGPARVFIRITDNGIGIVEEHLQNIFKIFFRGNNSKGRSGAGIGLYIVKEALLRMNGHIDITSRSGEGTCVELYIPNRHE